jgi:hypothetical protein
VKGLECTERLGLAAQDQVANRTSEEVFRLPACCLTTMSWIMQESVHTMTF